jgi:hypothetical protein
MMRSVVEALDLFARVVRDDAGVIAELFEDGGAVDGLVVEGGEDALAFGHRVLREELVELGFHEEAL